MSKEFEECSEVSGTDKHKLWQVQVMKRSWLPDSLGVDTLLFVFTHSRFKSVKYQPENVADFPILYSNVT